MSGGLYTSVTGTDENLRQATSITDVQSLSIFLNLYAVLSRCTPYVATGTRQTQLPYVVLGPIPCSSFLRDWVRYDPTCATGHGVLDESS